jgi:hypothetical protein
MIVCPVCNGKQMVPEGFYQMQFAGDDTTITAPEKCRTCYGAGVIEAFNKDRLEQLYYDKINEETLTKLEERS